MAKLKIGVKWVGLKELKRDLKDFAATLTDDTRPIVNQHAQEAAATMRASYPRSGKEHKVWANTRRGTPGPLADSVVVTEARPSSGVSGEFATSLRISNTAFYSHMFEYGTRHSEPGRVFVPIFLTYQREMVDAIKATFPAHNLRAKGGV